MLRQLRIQRRPPTPDEREILDDRPPHHDAVAIIVEAWTTLHSERHVAIASGSNGQTFWTRTVYGPIPWRAVRAWCRDHGLDRQNTQLVWSTIQYMDAQRSEREASARRLNGGQ